MKIDRLRHALQERLPIRDEDFDAIYPFIYRRASSQYWTPVETARRVTDLLVGEGARCILDVGAGVGKFCLVGAATTSRARFVGLEHRAHLVQAAIDATCQVNLGHAEMIHGQLGDVPLGSFDGFYFFNPFAENLSASFCLDATVSLSEERYFADVEQSIALLSSAPVGTVVVTYCGLGGPIPPAYKLIHKERSRGGYLRLWVKNHGLRWTPNVALRTSEPSPLDKQNR